ncbi:hypothetical protein ACVDG3_16085 [Meridianimarinicoccus sp. RP-17]|uniref:hypothetical protein n=1 Tax=Meridianimarinicoccus zhengii TaxID=2056810 RepID=UPI000DAF2C9F|nr:hypothetical protein [Phycocomes zhengii]
MARPSFSALVAHGAKAPPRVLLTAALVALAGTAPLGVVLQQVTGASVYAVVIFMGAVQLLATYRVAGSLDHDRAGNGRDSDRNRG